MKTTHSNPAHFPLNRHEGPQIREVEHIDFLPVNRARLQNGVPVWLLQAGSQEVAKIDLQFPAGAVQAGLPLLASTTASLMPEGTRHKSSKQISETFDYYGAFLNTQTFHHYTVVTLLCLSKHVNTLLPLVAEIINQPAFLPLELDIYLAKKREEFIFESRKVKNIAGRHLGEMLFGAHHPYGRQLKLTHFKQITPEQIKQFHARSYLQRPDQIFVAGRPGNDIEQQLNRFFGAGPEGNFPTEETVPQPAPSKKRFLLVEKPDALQSAISIGRPLFNYHHPHFIPLQMLNAILGGYFGSRLMTSIREQKGLTYGVGSFVLPLKHGGLWNIHCEVACENREAVIEAIFQEFETLRREPVGHGELGMVKNYLMGELLRFFDGPFSSADIFRTLHEYDLDFSFYQKMIDYLMEVTPENVQQMAQQYLNPADFWTAVAGK